MGLIDRGHPQTAFRRSAYARQPSAACGSCPAVRCAIRVDEPRAADSFDLPVLHGGDHRVRGETGGARSAGVGGAALTAKEIDQGFAHLPEGARWPRRRDASLQQTVDERGCRAVGEEPQRST